MQFNFSYLPNLITSVRFFLIYPILQSLFIENYVLAFYLLLIAGCTDTLDGQIARFYHWETQVGAFLDPLADKALLISIFAGLAYLAKLPWQLSAIVIGRDILIMLGVILYRTFIGPLTYQAILTSKINTTLQFILVICVLLQLNHWQLPQVLIIILMMGVSMMSIISIIQYIWIWGRNAWKFTHGKKI